MTMIHLWATGLVLVNLVWLGLTLVGLPGNWLMIATAAAAAWWLDPPMFAGWVFVLVVGLAALGELVELLAGAVGSKRSGGTRWGSVGALLGGVLGAVAGTLFIPLPVLGTILGAAIGAFAGAAALELASGRSPADSVRAGRGAAVGHVLGNLAKFSLGCAIWLTLALAAFL